MAFIAFRSFLSSLSCVKLMQTVPADDSINANRIRKRTNGYLAILRTPEYNAAQRALADGRISRMPTEPNPTDISISKRTWESAMQQWRNELQRIAQQHTGISTTTDSATPDT